MKWNAEIIDDDGKVIDCVEGDIGEGKDFGALFHRAYERLQQHRYDQLPLTVEQIMRDWSDSQRHRGDRTLLKEEGQPSFTIRFGIIKAE